MKRTLADREEKIQTQENELEASKNRWSAEYTEMITTIKTRVGKKLLSLLRKFGEKMLRQTDQRDQSTMERNKRSKRTSNERTGNA